MALIDAVPAEMMRSAQIMSGAVMALWLGIGFVPPLRRYAWTIRAVVLGLYLLAGAGFVAYAALWR